jgi:iron complex outermembrane recepter protein
MTDNEGLYQISGLPSGKMMIQFSYIGYSNKIETVILENTETELNVILETTTIKLRK